MNSDKPTTDSQNTTQIDPKHDKGPMDNQLGDSLASEFTPDELEEACMIMGRVAVLGADQIPNEFFIRGRKYLHNALLSHEHHT